MWLHTIKPSPKHTVVSDWCKAVVGRGWNHWGEMSPKQRAGAIRLVLLKTSSFSSVVSEPDASALCCIKGEMYPALGKACGDCISALHSALAYSSHLSNTIHPVVTLSLLFLINREYSLSPLTLCIWPGAPFALSSFPPHTLTLAFPKDLSV